MDVRKYTEWDWYYKIKFAELATLRTAVVSVSKLGGLLGGGNKPYDLRPVTYCKMMPVNTFELPITGMTCVGCAKSIERSLNLQKGVVSSAVNFTQNQVVVSIDPSQVDRDQVIQTIRDLGFEIVEANAGESLVDTTAAAHQLANDRQWRRLIVGLVLTIPLFLFSMGRDFGVLGHWSHAAWCNWVMFLLATPVQFFVGWDYYVSSYKSIRRRMANMDVLVSLGSTVAYVYSLVVTIALTFHSTVWGEHVYFETSATIVTLILLGRMVETRANARTGAAIKKLFGEVTKRSISRSGK